MLKEKIINFEKNKTMLKCNPILLCLLFIIGFIGLTVINTIVAYLIKMPIAEWLSDSFLSKLKEDPNYEKFYDVYINIINGILLFTTYFVLTIIFALIVRFNKETFENIKKSITKNAALEGVCIAIIILCISSIYNIISANIFPHKSNNNQAGIESTFSVLPILSFFSICIFAPFCEELTYRYGLFGLIAKKSKILAYIITILFFAFIHFDFTSDNLANEFINLPAYLIGAAGLSYAYCRKGNIVTSIVAHSTYNTIQFVLMVISTFIITQ